MIDLSSTAVYRFHAECNGAGFYIEFYVVSITSVMAVRSQLESAMVI